MNLGEYLQMLRNEIYLDAGAEDDEAFLSDQFTRKILDILADAGEIADAEVSYFERPSLRIDGYSADENEDTLDLFVALQSNQEAPVRLEKSKVDGALKQLVAFYVKAAAGLYKTMEEVEPAFLPAQLIFQQARDGGFSRVRLFLITDAVVNVDRIPTPPDLDGADVSIHVWDIERLFRWYMSGRDREQIVIDLSKDNLPPVRCLELAQPEYDYTSYLAIFPAEVLVAVYGKYGPRLLERNVRSFLQVRGDINKGIRSTILNEPQRFFAYNNGLTATASAVRIERDSSGSTIIGGITDLQIVNGGQTTASLFRAARKDKADVHGIAVQVKLNVVREDSKLDEIVGQISKFANSQNKVSVSDLSANDPFNRRLEELSRTIWAPTKLGAQRETKWFYERARAQYADELGRASTPTLRSRFEREYPHKQLFGKTEVAKYELAWDQRPHIVSRGAQKCFSAFLEVVQKRGNAFLPDEAFYRALVAKKILFDFVDDAVREKKYGGYKAQIVAYTIAYISHTTGRRFDFEEIWRIQMIPRELVNYISKVTDVIQQVIVNPPGGKDVTDWYKSEACWTKCLAIQTPLPAKIAASVAALGKQPVGGLDAPTEEEGAEIEWAQTVSPEIWFSISSWAKETGSLLPWQRSIAFSLGKLATQGKAPSRKQAVQGRKLHDEAIRLGFKVAT